MKRITSIILAAVLWLAVIYIPASAANVGGLSFTPPVNYEEKGSSVSDASATYAFKTDTKTTAGQTVYDSINVKKGTFFDNYIKTAGAVTSVRAIPLDTWKSWFASYQSSVNSNPVSKGIYFETVGGNEYLKLDFTEQPQGAGITVRFMYYIYIDGAGQTYNINYSITDTSMPQLAAFLDLMNTVRFTSPAQGPISIYVNGAKVNPDAAPFITSGRTLVPIRVIAEALGYSVKWFDETKLVSMQSGSSLIQIGIGDSYLSKGGQRISLDVPAQIQNGRTFLPLRAVGEAMGASVDWDGNTRSVYITK